MKHYNLFFVPAALIITGCHTSRHADAVASDSISTHLSAATELHCLRADSLDLSTLFTADSIVWQWCDSQSTRRAVAYGVSADRRLRSGSTESVTHTATADSTSTRATYSETHSEARTETPSVRWGRAAVAVAVLLLIAALGRYLRKG